MSASSSTESCAVPQSLFKEIYTNKFYENKGVLCQVKIIEFKKGVRYLTIEKLTTYRNPSTQFEEQKRSFVTVPIETSKDLIKAIDTASHFTSLKGMDN